jgi:NAD(P)-dependent dehydrogenase (short-subunit alcohol dehydrogenase family)
VSQNTIAENLGGKAQELGTRQFTLEEVPDLTGKIAVVTGGSEGIGYGCTYTLLKHNITKIYILSVSPEVVKGAQAAIRSELGQDAAGNTKWLQCDLTDWKRVKEVAEQIKSESDRLDILVNNAGRGIMDYQLTDYGVDRHMALNHMGHVVLTSHLLPLMKETAERGNVVRIVNLASNVHKETPSDTKFESLEELNRDLGPNGNYGRSKLAGVRVYPSNKLYLQGGRTQWMMVFNCLCYPEIRHCWLTREIDSVRPIFCPKCDTCRAPQRVDERHTPGHCEHQTEHGTHSQAVPPRRVRNVCRHGTVQEEPVRRRRLEHVCRHSDQGVRPVHLSSLHPRERQQARTG